MGECCRTPDNLVPVPTPDAALTIRQCRVCGRRQIELAVMPGQYLARTP
jgi:hypothetical protein